MGPRVPRPTGSRFRLASSPAPPLATVKPTGPGSRGVRERTPLVAPAGSENKPPHHLGGPRVFPVGPPLLLPEGGGGGRSGRHEILVTVA